VARPTPVDRGLIENPGGIGELPETGWRLLDRDDDRAVFGGESVDGLTLVSLRPDGDRWVRTASAPDGLTCPLGSYP